MLHGDGPKSSRGWGPLAVAVGTPGGVFLGSLALAQSAWMIKCRWEGPHGLDINLSHELGF